jgi:hypothetical protein
VATLETTLAETAQTEQVLILRGPMLHLRVLAVSMQVVVQETLGTVELGGLQEMLELALPIISVVTGLIEQVETVQQLVVAAQVAATLLAAATTALVVRV